MDLSVIILSYKSKENLKVLLPSVFASKTKWTYEVIVVDNGSNDRTVEWLEERIKNQELGIKNLKIIKNWNAGFTAGNNVGIKMSKGQYILL
jgi:glycosyltransferase involved in cell wall biosynthesis